MLAVAIPAALVAIMTLFKNNKAYVREVTKTVLNEMVVRGDLPTGRAQTEMKLTMTQGFKRVTDLEHKIENGMVSEMKKLDEKVDAIDSKVDQLIGKADA
jgi:polyhydroxyalkanoate synthesis regulator phasin